MPPSRSARERVGAWMWTVRPLYLVVEVALGLTTSVPYSFVDDTISDLGALRTPGHPLMNAAFIGFGVLMGLGAVLLHGRFGRGPLAVAATGFLVIAGLSSVATGLTPLDRSPVAHVYAATPVFLAQPAALVCLGLLLRQRHRRTGPVLVVTGVVSLVGAAAFILLDAWPGVSERIALWPTFVALAVVARLDDGRVSAGRGPAPARPAPGSARG